MIDLVRREVINSAHTIVVKVGTHVLSREDGSLDHDQLASISQQLAEIALSGRRVVLVSSGAIGCGVGRLKLPKRPTALPELQAAAAVGQADLIRAYDSCLQQYGLFAAQILLTAEDFDNRARYLNVRNTLFQLLGWNAIPVINENDTVSIAEIKFGDNDQLAAMVTNLIRAPLLVICSTVDGLYTSYGQEDGPQKPIDKILDLNEEVFALAGQSTSTLGTGGMRSKLMAARSAVTSGENVWIVNGRTPDVLRKVMNAEPIGTLMLAKGESMASWKRWIGYTARPRGSFVVDDGAEKALCDSGRSLLAVGVTKVSGEFEPGDVVAVENGEGVQFARGLTNYSSSEARQIMGQPSKRVAEILVGCRYEEIIHRDNLVLLDA